MNFSGDQEYSSFFDTSEVQQDTFDNVSRAYCKGESLPGPSNLSRVVSG